MPLLFRFILVFGNKMHGLIVDLVWVVTENGKIAR